ncbi:MAG TPA: YezD family protein [Candidatus Dormibacteraeota bacterium]|nr:YezD family protein [Candidatus Dormibacteraeota bacterium]
MAAVNERVPAGPRGGERTRISPVEEEILQAVRRIRYGSVEINIHDSQVVQIERKEKIRLR